MPSDYRDSVERDWLGWPKDFPQGEREALVELVRDRIEATRGWSGGVLSLHQVCDLVMWKAKQPEYQDRLPVFNGVVLWDYLYTCTHRALEEAGARRVWQLEE